MAWYPVASLHELEEDAPVAVAVGKTMIALFRIGPAVHATSNVCTHQFALMTDGFVEGHVVECPLHQGRFDIVTGKALAAPVCVDLQTYPARIEDGRVFVEVVP